MAFDASRPVPWKVLIRWAIAVTVIMNIGFFVFDRKRYDAGFALSSLFGGLIYLAIGALLSKFGWAPQQLGVRGSARGRSRGGSASAGSGSTTTTASSSRSSSAAADGPRGKPAPTKRTNLTNPRAKR